MKVIIKEYLKKISLVELLSLSFFIAVGFSLMFKYAFYSTLNIPWYLNSLTPQYLFISVLLYLFPVVTGIFSGIYFGNKFNIKWVKIITTIILSIVLFIFGLTDFWKTKLFFFVLTSLNCFTIMAFATALPLKSINKIIISSTVRNEINTKNKFFMILLNIFMLFAIGSLSSMPYLMGKYEGKYLLSNKNEYNLVVLKDKTLWRMVEMNNEKVLLISNNKFNSFTIIEYKEIKQIFP
ncbi:hypothetical protein KTJ16_00260 [Acinetobacter bereziniae]|uniref:hypothetical protein n=1 Tax=Acinetobacter bereziniae TaxID=106648 RepID=UPI0021CD68F1|nr:hypothetical protein [Acinetobacter bereziniae]MCU4539612.1 hypothetical protein [Acinetobacter bereziniae]MCU4624209.1 hypothetical protein [Acinetobacter bereziniae]